jgi:hypothetical protein
MKTVDVGDYLVYTLQGVNMANCPICGRKIGTFTDDPLLATPSLSTEENKGFIHLISTHIKEIQTERHQQEIDYSVIPLTEFTVIDDSRLFQNIKQYILELRNSTEKIMDITGQTLQEFLSTDEEGKPMTPKDNWTDPNLEEIKFQCKAIHIEDLRHFAQYAWAETYEKTHIDPEDPTSAIEYSLETDQSIFLTAGPPYNVPDKSCPLLGKSLHADKLWWITQTLFVDHDQIFSYARGNIFDNWTGVGVFNYSVNIDNLYSTLHMGCNMGFWSEKYSVPNYKCRDNLRFEIGTIDLNVDFGFGETVILQPTWTYEGITHDTAAEISANLAAMVAGGRVEIRVYFDNGQFISFYLVEGQHISIPSGSVLWNPDSQKGVYLYDSYVAAHGYISQENFNKLTVTYVWIYYDGIIGATWSGYFAYGFVHSYGYTLNSYVHVNYIFDNIRLVCQAP